MADNEYAGKVVLITGAARGQGRSHALAYARAGADLIICDRCEDTAALGYPLGSEADLKETVRQIEALGRRCVSEKLNTADRAGLDALVARGEAELGRGVDIAVANAGVTAAASMADHTEAVWDEVIGSNLTGVFNTIAAVAPGMSERGYGRIVTISSMLGRSSTTNAMAYTASKWGVIGMSKAAAQELAHSGVTVNVVAPGNIDTPMVKNDALYKIVRPDLDAPTWEDVAPLLGANHAQPIAILPPEDVTRVVLFLTAEGSAHLTGIVMPVDAGAGTRTSA